MRSFQGRESGPSVLIFSGVHGDEVSGVRASERFRNELEAGVIGVGGGQRNDRFKMQWAGHFSEQAFFGWESKPVFFHRTTAGKLRMNTCSGTHAVFRRKGFPLGPPFDVGKKRPFPVFGKSPPRIREKTWNSFRDFRVERTWQPNDFRGCRRVHEFLRGQRVYLRSGSHSDPNGEKNAYQAILNFLSALKMINGTLFQPIGNADVVTLKISSVYVAETANWNFTLSDRENLAPLKKGQTIGFDGTKEVVADSDCRLIMPKKMRPAKGEEVFFIGNVHS